MLIGIEFITISWRIKGPYIFGFMYINFIPSHKIRSFYALKIPLVW